MYAQFLIAVAVLILGLALFQLLNDSCSEMVRCDPPMEIAMRGGYCVCSPEFR